MDKPNEVSVYIITDYMKSLRNKAGIIFSSVEESSYLHAFFRLRRNLDPLNLPSLDSIRELMRKKASEEYTRYKAEERYLGHGQYAMTDDIFTDGKVALNLDSNSIDDLHIEELKDHQMEYFYKIIEYCRDHNVKLTFMIAPYAEYYFMYFEEYDAFTDLIKGAAKENGIDVIDLNLAKKEYLDIPASDFCNFDHINHKGACMASDFLVKYLREPSQEYFCDSIEEKYPKTPGVRAVGYHRLFLTDKGKSVLEKNAQGKIHTVRLDVSAVSYEKIPCRAELTIYREGEGGTSKAEVITGEELDAYTTRFEFPYSKNKASYTIRLLDPVTGAQIYEAETKLNMD